MTAFEILCVVENAPVIGPITAYPFGKSGSSR